MVDLAVVPDVCGLPGEVKPFGEEPDREEQLEHFPEPARAVRRGYHHGDEFPIAGEGVLVEMVQAPPEVVRAFAALAAASPAVS